jgi:hypothetical protein
VLVSGAVAVGDEASYAGARPTIVRRRGAALNSLLDILEGSRGATDPEVEADSASATGVTSEGIKRLGAALEEASGGGGVGGAAAFEAANEGGGGGGDGDPPGTPTREPTAPSYPATPSRPANGDVDFAGRDGVGVAPASPHDGDFRCVRCVQTCFTHRPVSKFDRVGGSLSTDR